MIIVNEHKFKEMETGRGGWGIVLACGKANTFQVSYLGYDPTDSILQTRAAYVQNALSRGCCYCRCAML